MLDEYGPSAHLFFKWLIFVAVAAFGIGAIGVSITSSLAKKDDLSDDVAAEPDEFSGDDVSNSRLTSQQSNQRIFSDESGVTLPKYLAIAVALSTVFSAIFSAFQWHAMRAQNHVALASLELSAKSLAVMEGELRAWVEIGQPIMRDHDGEYISFDILVTNPERRPRQSLFGVRT
jgi:hypothetical protein